jgi:F-type H+-transporting ATPase subunit a
MSAELAAATHGGEALDPASYIMHHVADGHDWEVPGANGMATDVHLDHVFGKWAVNLGGHEIDLTPTKYTLMLWVAAVLVMAGLWLTTRNRKAVPKGKGQTITETLFLFVRDEIAEKSIGHDGHKYTPYLATCFFFILTLNFVGLIPYAATATGNLNVTVVLALATFLMTQVAGMRAQGVVGYWTHLVPKGVPLWLYPLILVIEIVGLFTKPFALTMRLFANMVAGHIVLFFLLGLVFFLRTPFVGFGSVPLAFAIFLLEMFVAMVQAYIFTLLSAVFIGMASHAH